MLTFANHPTTTPQSPRLYANPKDDALVVAHIIVGLFYLYYFCIELGELRIERWEYFKSADNIVMLLNCVLYVATIVLYAQARNILPEVLDVDSPSFQPEVRSSMNTHQIGINIEAANTFINWFKVLMYLKLDPRFAALTDTLELAAGDMAGFVVCFLAVFYGFAQAHTMIFGRTLSNYRTLQQSCYTMLRSLLGEFDFGELRQESSTMGPVMFIGFIALAVLVILNMIIAIISDAYTRSRKTRRDQATADPFHIFDGRYLWHAVVSMPLIGPKLLKAQRKFAAAAEHDRSVREGAAATPNTRTVASLKGWAAVMARMSKAKSGTNANKSNHEPSGSGSPKPSVKASRRQRMELHKLVTSASGRAITRRPSLGDINSAQAEPSSTSLSIMQEFGQFMADDRAAVGGAAPTPTSTPPPEQMAAQQMAVQLALLVREMTALVAAAKAQQALAVAETRTRKERNAASPVPEKWNPTKPEAAATKDERKATIDRYLQKQKRREDSEAAAE